MCNFKIRLFLTIVGWSVCSGLLADDYFLVVDRECFTTGEELTFACENQSNQRVLIFDNGGKWCGKNPKSGSVWELSIQKEDEYILVPDNPVFFSGKSTIYISKKVKRFYWSEFAYSDILEKDDGLVRQGRIVEVNR